MLKCRDNDEKPTGKNITIEWDDGEKGNSNLILTEIFPSMHETWYLKAFFLRILNSNILNNNTKLYGWKYSFLN